MAYTNDPNVISRHERMISIHEAMEVDFTGLVCASSYRNRIYTGIGGLVDYMRGTSRSSQGKFIVTLHSLTEDGQGSSIVPGITPGSGLMASRAAVQYVVTEFGWTNLHGKSLRDRTIALLEIAHPKFRQELLSRAQLDGLLAHGEPITFSTAGIYPTEMEKKIIRRDQNLLLRPAKTHRSPFHPGIFLRAERSGHLLPLSPFQAGLSPGGNGRHRGYRLPLPDDHPGPLRRTGL